MQIMNNKLAVKVTAFVVAMAAQLVCMESLAAEFDLAGAKIDVRRPDIPSVRQAAAELRKHFVLISGEKGGAVRTARGRFVLGAAPDGTPEPKPFTSHAREKDGILYFWGDDSQPAGEGARYGTLFAVYGFLEKHLGVKWVEPGDRGIVFAPCKTTDVPAGWSFDFFPPLEMTLIRAKPNGHAWTKMDNESPRTLRIGKKRADELGRDRAQWMLRLRHQTRRKFAYGHAFTDWNGRFLTSHPEYLAQDKNGVRGLPQAKEYDRAKRVMLCVSNPRVVDQILADWTSRGTNEYLNACLNDSMEYCHCKNCCEWDVDLPGDPPSKYRTDRSLRFWNILCGKARAIRPDVKVVAYIYANYRQPPRRERVEFPENFLAGVVPPLEEDSEDLIQGWRAKGLRHYFVRPNYLCYVGTPPRGLERFFVEDFKRNLAGGMVGIDEDNYPRAVTLFETYALGRVAVEPNLSFAEIEREYLSQYGAAAEAMGRYFSRVRERGEKARDAAVARNKAKTANGESAKVLDDSVLFGTVYAAHTDSDFAGDLAVIDEALKVPGLSEAQIRRIRRARAIVENARLTRRFIVARDEAPFPEFKRLGREVITFRTENKDLIEDNWGRIFRGYPAEVRWWMRLKRKGFADDFK